MGARSPISHNLNHHKCLKTHADTQANMKTRSMFHSCIFYLGLTLDCRSRNGVTVNEELDGVAEVVLEAFGREGRKDSGAGTWKPPFLSILIFLAGS